KATHIASLLSITLATAAPLAPNVTFAQAPTAEADESPRPVRLEFDAKAVGDRALGLEDLLLEDLGPVFEANGAMLVAPARDEAPLVRVRVAGQFKDIELFKYELHFELVDGDQVTKLIEPVECNECYDDTIVATIEPLVPGLLE